MVAGEAIRIWASGHIEKTQKLATGGPYAHCRHPLYLGSALLALGVGVASSSLWVVVAVAIYFLAFFPSVMHEETGFLAKKFPDEFAAWATTAYNAAACAFNAGESAQATVLAERAAEHPAYEEKATALIERIRRAAI